MRRDRNKGYKKLLVILVKHHILTFPLIYGLTLNFEAGFTYLSLGLSSNLRTVQHLALLDHQGVAQAVLGCLEAITQGDSLVVHEPDQLNILRGNHTLEGGIFSFKHSGVVEFCKELHHSRH